MQNTMKKGQQSRNDLVILYAVCIIAVVVVVGALYGTGFIGNVDSHGSLEGITAAAVAVPVEKPIAEPIDNSTEPVEVGDG